MTTKEFESTFKKNTKVYKAYEVLKDKEWHCRECEYFHTGITQIAGGSGIQGLQRGSGDRVGMEIDSANHLCSNCDRTTRHDRWTGNYNTAWTAKSMPKVFAKRVINLLGSKDIVENVKRTANQITIDHKLPMIRWDDKSEKEQTDYSEMKDDDIRDRFQLLKKSNGSVSHNLLKSRSCESCWKTGKRGKPFGINFFYDGDERWKPSDRKDKTGCIGCGWYDIAAWRKALNKELKQRLEKGKEETK